MKKKLSKLIAFLITAALLFAIIPAGSLTVSASVNHTQAEAIEWIKARGNENWWQDVDGAYGCQCVDLAKAYYNYLVGYSVTGNGKDYASNSLPTGWYRDNNPTAGCIFYSTSGTYGHVGLVYSVSGSTLYTVETNTLSPYDGGSNSYARFITRSTSSVSGYIHPDFPAPHTHSYGAWQTVTAATCTTAGSQKRVCSCGDTQTQTINALGHSWNSGVVTTQPGCETKGVKTYTCSRCQGTRTEDISALGHNYSAVTVPATCTEDAYNLYTCTRCNDSYTEPVDGWTAWSTEYPPAGAEETGQKTQYRYRTKQFDHGTSPTKSGWITDGNEWVTKSTGTHYYFPRPNGFNGNAYTNFATSSISNSETATTKRVVSSSSHYLYVYWHWAYPYTYGVGTNTYIGDYYGDSSCYNDSATVWEAFDSEADLSWLTNSDGTVRVSDHSSYSYNWFRHEIYKQTYTDYEKQYKYYKWSDWSDWQDAAVADSSDRQVETRTVYRYKDDSVKAGHTYTSWQKDVNNHWHVCTVCGQIADTAAHIYDNASDTTCNVCGYIRGTVIVPDEDEAQAVVESKTAKPGETVTLTVELKNTPAIKSMAASNVSYDSSALTLESVEWKVTDAMLSRWNAEKGNGVVSYGSAADRNGKVLTITFKVKENAAETDYNIGIEYQINSGEENVTIATLPGTLTVRNYLPGDLNGDGRITDEDAIYLLFYTFFPEEYPVDQPIDFDGDGRITDEDAIYLLFYTFFPEDYPIK